MKQWMTIVTAVLMLAVYPAEATETKKSPEDTQQQSQAKPEKKSPGTMDKAGNSVKSGWHKFTKSVKQGRKKASCTPEQKSLKQCD